MTYRPSRMTLEDRDGDYIRKFSVDLCDHIKMRRFGEPIVVRFGPIPASRAILWLTYRDLPDLGHFAEDTDRAFIDVFG